MGSRWPRRVAEGRAGRYNAASHTQQEFAMPPTRVHRILDEVGSIAFAGVYDTLSAKLAQQAGFPMAFISGYSVAATAIGEPDLGLLTQTEMIERARRICGSVDIPIIVDADTGYGNPLNVYRTVKELIAAGAAGCFLEDQVWPKKCGHMRGKRVVEREEYVQKIRAAVEARGTADFFIVARTDALAPVGIDEAIARVTAAREAGADASFVEAPPSLELLAEIGRRAPKPMVANMLEGGKTPVLPKEQLADDGLPTDPLSADRPVRRGPRHRQLLPEAPRRRHHARRGASADVVRRVQRADRRRREVRPGRAVRRAVAGKMGTGSVAHTDSTSGETSSPRCLSPFFRGTPRLWGLAPWRTRIVHREKSHRHGACPHFSAAHRWSVAKGDRHRRRRPELQADIRRGDGASPFFRLPT